MLDRLVGTRLAGSTTSVLLLGPRQVGKSTLCDRLRPLQTIDLADEREFLRYSKDPSTLRDELRALPRGGLVVVDEVQRVPALLNVVQVMLDDLRGRFRFLLTGSSARKLRRGGANLLPGRVVLEVLDPLTVHELARPLDLQRALQVGMLPGIFLGGDEAVDVLGTYAEIYLREEIRAEGLTKNIGGYARFLDVSAIVSGQWLNYSKIASDTEVPKETIRRFVEILEDTLLLFRIPPFQPKQRISRRVSQRDRLLLFDVGVRNALLSVHRRPVSKDQFGPLFEQWYLLQAIYLNRALRKGWTLSSYRTEAGAEVDLVIERDDDIVGIEVKASRQVSRSDTRGLSSLGDTIGRYKPFHPRVAYLGETVRVLDNGVRVCPYLELLDEIYRGG
ncbi:MAG: ATP-binding protein [Gemmatimonadetes bacterium]|nr:ATP-binding protein [Gemmatimonadota bacterium]